MFYSPKLIAWFRKYMNEIGIHAHAQKKKQFLCVFKTLFDDNKTDSVHN